VFDGAVEMHGVSLTTRKTSRERRGLYSL
jgi:hypothetical protein